MRRLIPLALVPLVAACTVGPNYVGPPVAGSPGADATFVRGGAAVTRAEPAAGQWWRALGDATLDALEDRALAASPSIAVARSRIAAARATLRLERANQLPGAGTRAMYVHAELPGLNLGGSDNAEGGEPGGEASRSSLDFFNVGLDASWEIDLFGGQRRTVEASRATLGAAEANLADTQVQLAADVAQAYVNLRDRQAQLGLSRRSADAQRKIVDLTRQRLARGAASALDVERLQTQLNATVAQTVPIEAEIEALMNALAVLAGEQPGALDATLAAAAPVPVVPASVEVGDPTALLQRRPDIRAAERKLAERTARIGVAEASRFPRVSFMGIIGLGGTSPRALTDLDNLSALAIPQLQWQFLDFGRGKARVGQAEAQRDEAEAQYRQAVLAALKDAEDALSRFGHRRRSVAALAQASASADRAAALMRQRYGAGAATLIDTLDAERQRLSAEQNLASASAGLTGDFVALQKSLGLGWRAD